MPEPTTRVAAYAATPTTPSQQMPQQNTRLPRRLQTPGILRSGVHTGTSLPTSTSGHAAVHAALLTPLGPAKQTHCPHSTTRPVQQPGSQSSHPTVHAGTGLPTPATAHTAPHTAGPVSSDASQLTSTQASPASTHTQPSTSFREETAIANTASRLATYMSVRATGRPNYLQARIPLKSNLNIHMWRLLTQGHDDPTLCDMLEYGFPLGFEGTTVPTPTYKNHQSATAYPDSINEFLTTELTQGSLLGPFDHPPFNPWTQVSPLMTRPKRDSHSRRVIVDLSFPPNASVNSFTPTETYCGQPFKLRLPSAGTLQQKISDMNCKCFLYSCDIARAYRNIPTDPLAWPLCSIKFEDKYYIDTSLSFGARWSASSCQRVTDAVKYIMARNGHTVFNYIDDICGIAPTETEARDGYRLLKKTLASLGLPEAEHKACPPAASIVWLGIQFDCTTRTMRIPQAKISDTTALVAGWLKRNVISIKQVRSLLGKLLHIAQCSRPARLFLNRILASYRANSHLPTIPLDDGFKRDLQWFKDHLPQCNGVYMIDCLTRTHTTIECDSCLSGCGAIWENLCHHTTFPHFIMAMNLSICHLEALNCLVSIKLWAQSMANSTVKLLSDSMVTVNTLLNAKGRDPFLLKCAREMWLVCAKYNINLIPAHIPGTQMAGRADALSRRHLAKHYEQACISLINDNHLKVNVVDPYLFKLQQSL